MFFNYRLLLPRLLTLTKIISCLKKPDLSSHSFSQLLLLPASFQELETAKMQGSYQLWGNGGLSTIKRTSSSSHWQNHCYGTDRHRLLAACWPPRAYVAPLFLAFGDICHSGYVLHKTVMVLNRAGKEEHMLTSNPSTF